MKHSDGFMDSVYDFRVELADDDVGLSFNMDYDFTVGHYRDDLLVGQKISSQFFTFDISKCRAMTKMVGQSQYLKITSGPLS